MSMTRTTLCYVLALCVGTSVFAADAFAQSNRDLNNRLNRLENELNTINRAVFRGDRSGGAALTASDAAGAELRIQQLEVELRDLNGKLEEQSFEIRQLKSQLEKALADTNIRLQDLESGKRSTASAPSTTTPYTARTLPTKPTTTPDAVQPSSGGTLGTLSQPGDDNSQATAVSVDGAAASYENAFAKLKNSNYDAAETEFKKFLDQYPDHVLAPNARYWYGETFYVRGDYEKSARIFAEAYQKDTAGAKASDNLLKLGMSLAGMGNTDDACVALMQLNKESPSASTPVLRRAQQEMTRLGCS